MRRLKWFGFWTLLGLVSGVQLFFSEQRLALHPNAWWQALGTTLPACYLWGLLSIVVAGLGRRFRVDRANFGRHFFIHLGASLDLALLQLVAAVGVQDLLHAAAGEPFVFAQKLVDNFTLFYHWNVLIYWTILAVVHARDYHRDLEERRVALAGLERRLAARPVTDRLLVEDDGRRFFVDERSRLDGGGEELCPPPRGRPDPRAARHAQRARATGRSRALPSRQPVRARESGSRARAAALVPRGRDRHTRERRARDAEPPLPS